MTDGEIKGTGNSRYIKSVANFKTLFPTYDAYADAVSAADSDGVPIDLNGINPEGWRQLATALNKANLLKDSTAGMFGLSGDAVPDDAFLAIAEKISGVSAYAYDLACKSMGQYGGKTIDISDIAEKYGELRTLDGAGTVTDLILRIPFSSLTGNISGISRFATFSAGIVFGGGSGHIEFDSSLAVYVNDEVVDYGIPDKHISGNTFLETGEVVKSNLAAKLGRALDKSDVFSLKITATQTQDAGNDIGRIGRISFSGSISYLPK